MEKETEGLPHGEVKKGKEIDHLGNDKRTKYTKKNHSTSPLPPDRKAVIRRDK